MLAGRQKFWILYDKKRRRRNRPLGANLLMQIKKYSVFQKFVPIVNCILRKAFNASLGKCKLIQVQNLSK